MTAQENAGKPSYCCIALTESCFMQCKMCYKGRRGQNRRDPGEPQTGDWKRFILSLRKFVKGLCINFAGGEALLREDCLELIKYAADLEFRTLLASNGYLINEKMAKMISASGLETVVLSLDSTNQEKYDFLRGVKGAFKRVMDAIHYLNKYSKSTRIDFCSIISEQNLDDLVELARWVNSNMASSNIFFQAITQPFSTPIEDNWHQKDEYSFLWPKDKNKVNRVLDELIELKEAGFRMHNTAYQLRFFKSYFDNPAGFIKKNDCHLDTQALNVTSLGEIRLCFYMDPIGSIKQEQFDMEHIWHCAQAAAVREGIRKCKRNCQSIINCTVDKSEENK